MNIVSTAVALESFNPSRATIAQLVALVVGLDTCKTASIRELLKVRKEKGAQGLAQGAHAVQDTDGAEKALSFFAMVRREAKLQNAGWTLASKATAWKVDKKGEFVKTERGDKIPTAYDFTAVERDTSEAAPTKSKRQASHAEIVLAECLNLLSLPAGSTSDVVIAALHARLQPAKATRGKPVAKRTNNRKAA